jgi:hypothetical protein
LGKDLREIQIEKGGLDLFICIPVQDISNANVVLVLNSKLIGDIKFQRASQSLFTRSSLSRLYPHFWDPQTVSLKEKSNP